jgi:hypothetical protein
VCEHEFQWPVDQAELSQRAIDEAIAAQDGDPGVGPHDFPQKQGRDGHHEDEGLERPAPDAHQGIGQRVRNQQRKHGRLHAQPQGVGERVEINRLGQVAEVGERESADIQGAGHIRPEAELQDRNQRYCDARGAFLNLIPDAQSAREDRRGAWPRRPSLHTLASGLSS